MNSSKNKLNNKISWQISSMPNVHFISFWNNFASIQLFLGTILLSTLLVSKVYLLSTLLVLEVLDEHIGV